MSRHVCEHCGCDESPVSMREERDALRAQLKTAREESAYARMDADQLRAQLAAADEQVRLWGERAIAAEAERDRLRIEADCHRADYLTVADAIMPESTGPTVVAHEVKRLRDLVTDRQRLHADIRVMTDAAISVELRWAADRTRAEAAEAKNERLNDQYVALTDAWTAQQRKLEAAEAEVERLRGLYDDEVRVTRQAFAEHVRRERRDAPLVALAEAALVRIALSNTPCMSCGDGDGNYWPCKSHRPAWDAADKAFGDALAAIQRARTTGGE